MEGVICMLLYLKFINNLGKKHTFISRICEGQYFEILCFIPKLFTNVLCIFISLKALLQIAIG